ncbi:MAG: sigma-54 dependent transcriptional regulator, partial [Myxococcota bacterium]
MAEVLVVDDEEGVREFVAEALSSAGHQVRCARDGVEALAAIRTAAVEVVLTDVRMPKLDGLALLEVIRREFPEVPVILLTAHGDIAMAVSAMRAGAFDFLEKPVGALADLRRVVDRAVAHRRTHRRVAVADRARADRSLTFGAPAMDSVVQELNRVARTNATVLLTGESGTGKEVCAQEIHRRSTRCDEPFVALNCAALVSQLVESELFGHERGAFTGASTRRPGRIELASGGTFFLDEIGELSAELQAKLLRVLQERKFERVGGTQTLTANVRWIAATNRDLHAMMKEGKFREDLYHRLAVFPIRLPPLRDRREDIVPLA